VASLRRPFLEQHRQAGVAETYLQWVNAQVGSGYLHSLANTFAGSIPYSENLTPHVKRLVVVVGEGKKGCTCACSSGRGGLSFCCANACTQARSCGVQINPTVNLSPVRSKGGGCSGVYLCRETVIIECCYRRAHVTFRVGWYQDWDQEQDPVPGDWIARPFTGRSYIDALEVEGENLDED